MGRLCYPTKPPDHLLIYFSQKTVTVQGGYGALFAIQVQILLRITRVAVQFVSKPEICHGAGIKLLADARVRVQEPLQICLGSRSKSKKCDNTTYPYCPC
jgi:hypothetical protein